MNNQYITVVVEERKIKLVTKVTRLMEVVNLIVLFALERVNQKILPLAHVHPVAKC